MTTLLERIGTREAKVVVVGAGYVGLPLAVEVAKAGFKITAYDKSVDKVQSIGRGVSYINDVSSETLAPLVEAGTLDASADPDVLSTADVVIICVPTPLNKTKDPDNSFIMDAAEMLARRMRRPQLVVLESTTFPGFTREVLLPRFVQAGRKPDEDFFLAFSPERVDPGNPKFFTQNTPKVLGGIAPRSLEVARRCTAASSRRRAGVVHRQRRDGQAAREHLPRGQHRPRQRGGDHVRRASGSTPGR